MSYHIELLGTLEAVDAVKDEWQALCAALPGNTGFFSSYSYLRTYLAFHQPATWAVAAIYSGDKSQLLAIFPLSFLNIESEGQHFLACKPLATPYAPYFDFAVQSQERRQVLRTLLQLLRVHLKCDVALLGPLHESSPLCTVLLQDLDAQQLKIIGNPASLSEIETRGQSFEEYFRRKKSLTLPDARYQARRLRKLGQLDLCLADHGDDMEEVVLEMCRRNEDHFADVNYYRQHPAWQSYLTALARQLAPQGLAEVSTLRIDGKVIASALCFLQPGRRSLYMTAFDPEFARYSPSKILLAHMIEQSFDEKSIFCFGAGDYAYKRDWSQSVGDRRTPVIYLNPQARLALDQHLVPEKLGRFIRNH